nr:MAG TPA: hypothetical protein [Myoviridae sp. ctfA14]
MVPKKNWLNNSNERSSTNRDRIYRGANTTSRFSRIFKNCKRVRSSSKLYYKRTSSWLFWKRSRDYKKT